MLSSRTWIIKTKVFFGPFRRFHLRNTMCFRDIYKLESCTSVIRNTIYKMISVFFVYFVASTLWSGSHHQLTLKRLITVFSVPHVWLTVACTLFQPFGPPASRRNYHNKINNYVFSKSWPHPKFDDNNPTVFSWKLRESIPTLMNLMIYTNFIISRDHLQDMNHRTPPKK